MKKGSRDYLREDHPPPCPSVMVNGELIAEGTVTYEALKQGLRSAGAGPQGAA